MFCGHGCAFSEKKVMYNNIIYKHYDDATYWCLKSPVSQLFVNLFSALLALCEGNQWNPPMTDGFPSNVESVS